jgi:glyoxylase-like metal-dependent hydrolase (beta-lactamase superfamily II)
VIRVVLPTHLRTLAQVRGEVQLEVEGPVTQSSVLDALETAYPMLRGAIREHGTLRRRPFVRFFACEEDLSHEPPDVPLPDAVASGREPFLVVGAMSGGAGDAEYTGRVVPGGPPGVRVLRDLAITKVSVGAHDNNAFLLRWRATGEQLLIDAADDAPRLLGVVGSDGLTTLVTTHGHFDHWQALREVVEATRARTYAHPLDAGGLPVPPDELVEDGATIPFAGTELEVIHLVGHTPGGIALLYREPDGRPHLFSGDSLFPGGVGNTDKDPERFRSLMTDVETKVFARLPDETWVYPGHGNDTTLGAERPSLPEWWARGW